MTDAYGWIIDKRCRICGGPITAIRSPIKVRSDDRMADDDEVVDVEVEGGNKYRSKVLTRYEHIVSGFCGRCGMGFSIAQMEDGEPDPPMLARVGA